MPHSKAVLQARSRVGVESRRGDQERITEAKKDLAEAKIAQFITRTLAEAPPLSAEQRTRLAAILAPVVGGELS